MTIRTAIVGPTGYTGLGLIQLLDQHPQARLTYLASRRDDPTDIRHVFPRLKGVVPEVVAMCRPIDPQKIASEADVAFVALPHGVSMSYVPSLLEAGLCVIDLSADYRISDAGRYETVYGRPHVDPKHLAKAVYGLPELFRDQIPNAQLVANPGCYPTAAALGITPFLRAGLIRPDSLIINAASGVTGAGKKPAPHLLFGEQNEAFGPYGRIGGHRHQPEIDQTLSTVTGESICTLFVPHLLPINQGILETIYAQPVDPLVTEQRLYQVFEDAYRDEPFVRVRADLPNIKHVADTPFCDLAVRIIGPENHRVVVIFSVIDNLIKGASGQAIQNMNILFGLEETMGLLNNVAQVIS